MTREIFQACDPVKLLFGTFVLWVNWYSFNVGSTTKITGGGVETASRAALTTTLAAAAGAILSMIISDLAHGYVLPETLTTGLLGSLVAITAPCAVCTPIESAAFDWPTHRPHIYRLDEDFSAESATRFASKFADRELWYRREGGIDEHGNRKMKLTFWAPFAIAFDVIFTVVVLYLLYKAVRWALGRGGGAAPAAEAKGGKAKAKAQ